MTHNRVSPAYLVAAAHTHIATPPGAQRAAATADRALDFDGRVLALAGIGAEQAERVVAHMHERPDLHLVCSTTLSKMVSGHDARASALLDAIGARCGVRPSALLLAYQCAGWGYAIRFALTHAGARTLLITIVDDDLHDMMRVGYEAVIGRIGYGVTTIALELREALATLVCDGPFANRGFADLLHAVRRMHQRRGASPTFLPFLPDGLAGIAQRSIGEALGANRHEMYGHTFGADPWIGLGEWLHAARPDSEREVTLGAFAFDGYCTAATLSVDPRTRFDLRFESNAWSRR